MFFYKTGLVACVCIVDQSQHLVYDRDSESSLVRCLLVKLQHLDVSSTSLAVLL